MPWFPVRGRVRVFHELSLEALERFRPQVLAGCVGALRELARLYQKMSDQGVTRGPGGPPHNTPLLPSLTHGILAITATGRPALSTSDRELLWEAFQVPVWEQCRCWDGTLFAEECAAHEGLHLRGGTYPATPPGTVVLYERCSCGDPSPRIVTVPEMVSTGPIGVAATAAVAGPMLSL